MTRKISDDLRQLVAERVDGRCEYCLVPESGFLMQFHVDHIRSLKHGGATVFENLAYSCSYCNYHKGSDLGTYLEKNDSIVRFLNLRTDKWSDHFELANGAIHSKTDIGEGTVRIFQFNTPERIILPQEFILSGEYP